MISLPWAGAIQLFMFLGGIGWLSKQVWRELTHGHFEGKLLMDQILQIGSRSMPLILITAISIGMVMTFQFGIGLEKFGGQPYIPKIVSLSIIREMGPVFTSLMIAARVGAGITSEIGSMVVTQQVDAMRAMGTSPIRKIVIPRLLACLIALPLLAALANIVGVAGGMYIGVTELKLDPGFYLLKVQGTIKLADFFSGFAKTFFFALIIALIACHYGLNVKEGTKEVGMATTKSVVMSSILILVGDFFLTKFFWMIEKWV